jgi:hypothetical protein
VAVVNDILQAAAFSTNGELRADLQQAWQHKIVSGQFTGVATHDGRRLSSFLSMLHL